MKILKTMRKAHLIKYFSLIGFMGMSFSCSDEWLDVNTDPNNASNATAQLVLPAGVVSGASVVGGYYNLIGGMWSQYWTQSNAANQYKGLDQYQVQSADYNAQWREMYAGCLNDLNYVIKESKVAGDVSTLFMATVAQVYFFQVMVDFYSDIPFSEAFRGLDENLSPKYENGQQIYDSLIARLDKALPKEFNLLDDKQKRADLVFGGEMEKWVAFANTLKLKIYLRQMYMRPQVAEQGVKALYASGADFLTEDAGLDIFEDAENKDNPLYASDKRKLNVATNLRVSSTIYRYFEQNNDPRLGKILAEKGKQPMPQGGFSIPSTQLDPTSVAIFKLSPVAPVYFISEVESYLLQAEAIAKGWGTGDDKALYEKAITADFERNDLNEDNVSADKFVGDGLAYDYPENGTFDEKQEAIIMAKWAAFVGSQGLESFFERSRTGYPLQSSVLSWSNGGHNSSYIGGRFTYSLEGVTNGQFPARMIYPQAELQLNVNHKAQTSITDKVWWDTK